MTTRYVSPTGNAANDGLSELNPLSSLADLTPLPGDVIRLVGGATFAGSLQFASPDPKRPVTIAGYGNGRPILQSGQQQAVYAWGAGGLTVQGLELVGDPTAGYDEARGVQFGGDNGPGGAIHVLDCVIRGYALAGVFIASGPGGLRDVRVEGNWIERCGNGLLTGGDGDGKIVGLVVRNNWIHDIEGEFTPGAFGMQLSGVYSGLIERNLIHDCGRTGTGMAHAGIMVSDSSYVVVQYNEIYHIFDLFHGDGQGITLNGSDDCLAQYNYVHDCGGTGILVCTQGQEGDGSGEPPSRRNVIRWNVVENSDQACVCVHDWSSDTDIYRNTFFARNPRPDRIRLAMQVAHWTGRIARFLNNVVCAHQGAMHFMLAATAEARSRGLQLAGNLYYREDSPDWPLYTAWNDEGVYRLEDLRSLLGQEILGGRPVGLWSDPKLYSPGYGVVKGDPSLLGTLAALDSYRVWPGSPCLSAGVDLKALGIDQGAVDFWGQAVPNGNGVGACAVPMGGG